MATVKLSLDEHGEGELTAAALRGLLSSVPDTAVVEVNTNDVNDYREGGKARWWFSAKWESAPGVKTPRPPLKAPRRERLRSSIVPPSAPTTPATVQPVPRPDVDVVFHMGAES